MMIDPPSLGKPSIDAPPDSELVGDSCKNVRIAAASVSVHRAAIDNPLERVSVCAPTTHVMSLAESARRRASGRVVNFCVAICIAFMGNIVVPLGIIVLGP